MILNIDKLIGHNNRAKDAAKFNKVRNSIANIYLKKLDNLSIENIISEEKYQRDIFLYVDVYRDNNYCFFDETKIFDNGGYLSIEDGSNKFDLKIF